VNVSPSRANVDVAPQARRLRIIHVLNHVRRTGNGIVNVAVDLACAQAAAGHTVLIVSVGGHYESLLAQCGVVHEKLDQRRNPRSIMLGAWRLSRIVSAFKPDIVHAHMVTGMILAVVARLGRRYRLMSTVHNIHDRSSNLMGLADRVIAVSAAVAASMQKRGIPARKLRVVTNGTLGSKRTRPIDAYPIAELEHPAITTVAGMDKRKGIDVLIRAFAGIADAYPQAHLYIVGDGPDRARFEQEAAASGAASRIHFEGFAAEPQRYLRATQIFVLASFADSNPLVLSEAREAGCAIVASAVDGIPEALDDGAAGILVPPGDSQQLARAIGDLLRDSAALDLWRDRAAQRLERFHVARVSAQTVDAYLEK
jgi:glycosyltransferase involved in cell wall biosynthesis